MVFREHLTKLLLLVLATVMLSSCSRQASLVEQQFFEFGTLINVSLISDDKALAISLLQQIESDLKRWRGYWHGWQDSDLTRFNQQLQQQHAEDMMGSAV